MNLCSSDLLGRVSHALFKITSFVDSGPYLKSFDSLEEFIYQLRSYLTDMVMNPRHQFMEDDLLKVTDQVPSQGITVSS